MSPDELVRLHDPVGLGIYIRDIQRRVHGTPGEAAEWARQHGVQWVALLACWQHDGTDRTSKSNEHDLRDYGQAFRDHGIAVWVWGYPVAGNEAMFSWTLREGAEKAGAVGMLVDPEVSYKSQPEAGQELIERVYDSMDERHGFGLTSYGVPRWHNTLPWGVFGGHGWGSPQLYSVAPYVVRQGLQEWRDLGWEHIVPSVPAFGERSGSKLAEHLGSMRGVPGIAVWSWRQIDNGEWRVLREWTERQ